MSAGLVWLLKVHLLFRDQEKRLSWGRGCCGVLLRSGLSPQPLFSREGLALETSSLERPLPQHLRPAGVGITLPFLLELLGRVCSEHSGGVVHWQGRRGKVTWMRASVRSVCLPVPLPRTQGHAGACAYIGQSCPAFPLKAGAAAALLPVEGAWASPTFRAAEAGADWHCALTLTFSPL